MPMTVIATGCARRSYVVSGYVLVMVICLLPPLVRATAHMQDITTSPSSLRLNRGFDVPASKWTVAPPATESFDRTVRQEAEPSWPALHAVCDVEHLRDHQHYRSPDPLRGPPRILIS
jgi:hypothetical protein